MIGVLFQEEQGLFVLPEHVLVFFDECFGSLDIAVRKDEFIGHR